MKTNTIITDKLEDSLPIDFRDISLKIANEWKGIFVQFEILNLELFCLKSINFFFCCIFLDHHYHIPQIPLKLGKQRDKLMHEPDFGFWVQLANVLPYRYLHIFKAESILFVQKFDKERFGKTVDLCPRRYCLWEILFWIWIVWVICEKLNSIC